MAAQDEGRHCALCDVDFTNYERHKGGRRHQRLLRAQEGWAGDTVTPAPGHDPGHDPGLDESEHFEQMPEVEEEVVTRPPVGSLDVPISKKAAVGQKTQSSDLFELARQSDLSSSQIRVAGEEEKELEKRVRGIRLKVNQKRDSVIMLRNVLKMKKDEVSELRKTLTHIEPVRSASSSKISHSSSWGVKRSVPYHSPVSSGNFPFHMFSRQQRSLVDIGEEESRVQRRREGAAVIETSGDELDQESLDWLARRRLMRENTRKSGTASSTSKGSHSLMRNITTPEGRRRKPEVIVVEDNMASTKTNMLKR